MADQTCRECGDYIPERETMCEACSLARSERIERTERAESNRASWLLAEEEATRIAKADARL